MKKYPGFCLLAVILLVTGCKDGKRYHHEQGQKASMVEITNPVAEVIAFQKALNAEYKDPDTSPLPDRYRKDFEGLDYFEPDPTYRVVAFLERTPEAVPFLMPTTTERMSTEVVFGIARFSLNGQTEILEVYQNKELILEEEYTNYLFLPFLDDTNGKESYTGGRYIDLRIPEGDSIVIDFNKAYNPYCAYNKKYSCPVVPPVNRLHSPVKAGVKAFKP